MAHARTIALTMVPASPVNACATRVMADLIVASNRAIQRAQTVNASTDHVNAARAFRALSANTQSLSAASIAASIRQARLRQCRIVSNGNPAVSDRMDLHAREILITSSKSGGCRAPRATETAQMCTSAFLKAEFGHILAHAQRGTAIATNERIFIHLYHSYFLPHSPAPPLPQLFSPWRIC